jgi:hypothetical protein
MGALLQASAFLVKKKVFLILHKNNFKMVASHWYPKKIVLGFLLGSEKNPISKPNPDPKTQISYKFGLKYILRTPHSPFEG